MSRRTLWSLIFGESTLKFPSQANPHYHDHFYLILLFRLLVPRRAHSPCPVLLSASKGCLVCARVRSGIGIGDSSRGNSLSCQGLSTANGEVLRSAERTNREAGDLGLSTVDCELLTLFLPGAGGVTSLGSRGVTEDVKLPKELTPVTSHSIAFVEPTLHRTERHSIR